jgi:D-alanyl-D-alanine carboxypeptidase/D-alanyl-D-alanine-endopeptidase (penicillin-binding protein 4)
MSSLRARLEVCAAFAAILFAAGTRHSPLRATLAAQPSPAVQTGPSDLQRALDRIVEQPALERGYWGVLIRSLDTDETLYSVNPAKLMMPASALKVVTVAAAAERLGWDYRYDTRLVADGTIRGDTLDGDLIIVGNGDPSLDRPTLDVWAAQLKALGVTRVTGTVLADARAFSGEGLGFGWSWDDLAYYYAAPIAATQFRENAVDLTLRPGASAGVAPLYELTPPGISGLRVENHMITGPATATPEFVARRAPNSPVVVLEGVVPAASPPVSHSLSVHDPVRFLAAALTEALLAAGVTLGRPPPLDAGADRTRNFSDATPLLMHRSAPLRVLARRLMEVSQNQYSETLIKTMGAQAGNPTFEGGLKAEETVLASWGIPSDGAVLRDGSGLSRYDYVTPDTLVRVLSHMYREPAHNGPFFSLLNVAGQNGTIAPRLKSTAAAGNARVKDGSMAGVRSLCGIVKTADGETLVFAILANNFAAPGPTVTAAIDAIVVQLASFKR